jgi:hypothetical protein
MLMLMLTPWQTHCPNLLLLQRLPWKQHQLLLLHQQAWAGPVGPEDPCCCPRLPLLHLHLHLHLLPHAACWARH